MQGAKKETNTPRILYITHIIEIIVINIEISKVTMSYVFDNMIYSIHLCDGMMGNRFNNFCNLLLTMHRPCVVFLSELIVYVMLNARFIIMSHQVTPPAHFTPVNSKCEVRQSDMSNSAADTNSAEREVTTGGGRAFICKPNSYLDITFSVCFSFLVKWQIFISLNEWFPIICVSNTFKIYCCIRRNTPNDSYMLIVMDSLFMPLMILCHYPLYKPLMA